MRKFSASLQVPSAIGPISSILVPQTKQYCGLGPQLEVGKVLYAPRFTGKDLDPGSFRPCCSANRLLGRAGSRQSSLSNRFCQTRMITPHGCAESQLRKENTEVLTVKAKMVQPLWKSVWQFLRNVKIYYQMIQQSHFWK